jgi:CDP-diacylglycerol--glycerol-3-phosphate 3-phosphatidyltransferase
MTSGKTKVSCVLAGQNPQVKTSDASSAGAAVRKATLNLPNRLTFARLVLTAIFLAVIFSGIPYHQTIALALFIVASVTDYYDGMIARRDKLITNFGVLMDPLADKILTCSAFIAFIELNQMPAWMVVIIVARELAITGLRLLAASQHLVLAAESWGKHKTVSQMVAIISVLTLMSYDQWGGVGQGVFGWKIGAHSWLYWLTATARWVAVILTFVSGSVYLWRNRTFYLKGA